MRKIIILACMAALLPAGAWAAGEKKDAAGAPETGAKSVWNLPQKSIDFMSVDRLLSEALHDAKGEVVGEITDVFLDQRTGRAIYVRVSTGGFLGLNEELHLVPYKALSIQGDRITVNADRQKIAGAPAWKEGIDESKFGQSLHDYYGVAPEFGEQAEVRER